MWSVSGCVPSSLPTESSRIAGIGIASIFAYRPMVALRSEKLSVKVAAHTAL